MVNPAPKRRQIPLAEQRRRSAELATLRLTRGLTDAEQAEAEALAHRAYMRAWHAAQAAPARRRMGAGQ